jgi:hypothetical protein
MGCKLDHHPHRTEIDQQYLAGASLRTIASTYGIGLGTAHRHKTCIRELLSESRASEREERCGSLLARVEELIAEGKEIVQLAKADKKYATASNALNAVGRNLELIAKLTGELVQPNAPGLHLHLTKNTVNINNYNDDIEFALLIKEATKSFDPATIEHLKALAASAIIQP